MSEIYKPSQDLVTTDFDSMFEEVSEDSVLLQRQELEQQSIQNIDLDDFVFKNLKTSKGQNFVFFHPDEMGKETTVIDRGDVFAFRGVPIKFRFGFSLFDSDANIGICRTSAIQMGDKRIQSSHPLSRPVYSPAMVGEKAPDNTPRPEILGLNPIGTRGKSCSECVLAGEHVHVPEMKEGDKPKQPQYCGLQSSVIFAVFQVGILKPEMKGGAPYEGVEWIDAKDFKNIYGIPMADGPFIVNMRMPRKAATCSVSSRGFQPVVEPFNAIPAQAKTTAQTIRNLYDQNLVKPMKIRGEDELLYRAVYEVYAGRPKESCAQSFERTKNVPMWSQISLSDEDVMKTVKAAWAVYFNEKETKPDDEPVKSLEVNQPAAGIAGAASVPSQVANPAATPVGTPVGQAPTQHPAAAPTPEPAAPTAPAENQPIATTPVVEPVAENTAPPSNLSSVFR